MLYYYLLSLKDGTTHSWIELFMTLEFSLNNWCRCQLFGEGTPLETDCLSRCLLEKVLSYSVWGTLGFTIVSVWKNLVFVFCELLIFSGDQNIFVLPPDFGILVGCLVSKLIFLPLAA